MTSIPEMLQSRTHQDHLLQASGLRAYLFKIHDRQVADLHCDIVELGDHELERPIEQSGVFVQQAAEVVSRKEACFLGVSAGHMKKDGSTLR